MSESIDPESRCAIGCASTTRDNLILDKTKSSSLVSSPTGYEIPAQFHNIQFDGVPSNLYDVPLNRNRDGRLAGVERESLLPPPRGHVRFRITQRCCRPCTAAPPQCIYAAPRCSSPPRAANCRSSDARGGPLCAHGHSSHPDVLSSRKHCEACSATGTIGIDCSLANRQRCPVNLIFVSSVVICNVYVRRGVTCLPACLSVSSLILPSLRVPRVSLSSVWPSGFFFFLFFLPQGSSALFGRPCEKNLGS